MKILFLTHLYPPNHIGGTENYTHGLAKGLIQAGHQVNVLCVQEWAQGGRYWNGYADDVYEGVSVRRLHLNWTKAPDVNRYLYDNPLVAQHLKEYLAEWQPDIVHVTSCTTLSASVIAVAKQAGLPVVVTLTDFWFICPRVNLVRGDGSQCDGQKTAKECLRCMSMGSKIYQIPSRVLPKSKTDDFLDIVSHRPFLTNHRGLRGMVMDMTHRKEFLHEALSSADVVIAPSVFLKDVFSKNGFTMPIQVMPYGHDLSWLAKIADKKPSELIRFGYMGQIIPIKGVHVVLQAFVNTKADAKASLSIFGDLHKDPAYAQQLQRIASGHSNIHFEGAFTHERLGDVLSQLDMVIVPSLWSENNPLVIQEAFAAKVPVIATALRGLSEFVQSETNGLLFNLGDIDDLARQLLRVINEPGLLERLGAGISAVKDIAESVTELLTVYRELGNLVIGIIS
ncbi:Alpha-D-kanosaminyltransferase [Anaerolineae bacterium]|nr:Alpha-D-kanosaminyltransferase [Anaerolineae bacterium]